MMDTTLASDNGKTSKSRIPEFAAVIVFAAALIIVTIFHEPWFDEAQAWQIAKDTSYKDILFTIPHYEGHPQLWHLILSIPAKAGVSFEIGLKSVGFIFSILSVLILEFRSPFPRIVKLLIPFTYFFFYQYGVIVRPYCIMILAYFLLACTFQKRNEKPVVFVLSLALLCSTTSFGIVVAGGIAVTWLFEIWKELGTKGVFHCLFSDARLRALTLLLIFALFLVISVMPASDSFVLNEQMFKGSFFKYLLCILCTTATSISQTFVTSADWLSTDTQLIALTDIGFQSFFPAILVDILLWILIIVFSTKKNLKYIIIPYLCYAVFGAIVYFGGHHLGISHFLLLFWLWIATEDPNRFEVGKAISNRLKISEKDIIISKKFAIFVIVCCITVPACWTVSSSVLEIKYAYNFGRNVAAFLEENQLTEANIAVKWSEAYLENEEDNSDDDDKIKDIPAEIDYEKSNTITNATPVSICAYFPDNIIYNFNNGNMRIGYNQYKSCTEQENIDNIALWKQSGAPDVLIGKVNVEFLTDGIYTIADDYSPVYCSESAYIWKGRQTTNLRFFVFVRNDLLDKYDLKMLDLPDGINAALEPYVSDSMREAFFNGVPAEEIIDEQMDFFFNQDQ